MATIHLKRNNIFSVIGTKPYNLNQYWKDSEFRQLLIDITGYHNDHCETYRNILNSINFTATDETSLEQLPFLPVNIFKYINLTSVPIENVTHVLTSSGTSRNSVSRIHVDKETSLMQMRALHVIVTNFLGSARLPMLIFDHEEILNGPSGFSARATGIKGFSLFGTNRTFALNENLELDFEVIRRFLESTNGKPFFVFGFTFIIWEYVLNYLERVGIQLELSQGILIHGGGWKRLKEQDVSDERFKERLYEFCRLEKTFNYYGMVEQTGSIYMQCEQGFFHCSAFSELFIRKHSDFSSCLIGEPGIIQSISLLPLSYPGHNLLTEDEGVLAGKDDCLCGRKGKYFKIIGRMKQAELKGCGDADTIR